MNFYLAQFKYELVSNRTINFFQVLDIARKIPKSLWSEALSFLFQHRPLYDWRTWYCLEASQIIRSKFLHEPFLQLTQSLHFSQTVYEKDFCKITQERHLKNLKNLTYRLSYPLHQVLKYPYVFRNVEYFEVSNFRMKGSDIIQIGKCLPKVEVLHFTSCDLIREDFFIMKESILSLKEVYVNRQHVPLSNSELHLFPFTISWPNS